MIGGTTVTVKVAHMRLCHSRMMFVRAYPRETQEMVFDAHDRAFGFFKGVRTRGTYDNMKTAVDTVFVGEDRKYTCFTRVTPGKLTAPHALSLGRWRARSSRHLPSWRVGGWRGRAWFAPNPPPRARAV